MQVRDIRSVTRDRIFQMHETRMKLYSEQQTEYSCFSSVEGCFALAIEDISELHSQGIPLAVSLSSCSFLPLHNLQFS